MEIKETQTVISAIIRVCRASIRSFCRFSPQLLNVVLTTALHYASTALPMVSEEYLHKEILGRILNAKVITADERDTAVAMLKEMGVNYYYE